MVDRAPSFIVLEIFWAITFFEVLFWTFREKESERERVGGQGRGRMGASSYKRAQVARSYGVERGGGGSESLSRERIVRTAGKWVPTSELAPLVPLVGSSSFAENSIIMIAYDVNDAPRQQLFPPERARGAAGPDTIVLKSRTRPRDAKDYSKRTIVMAAFRVIELDRVFEQVRRNRRRPASIAFERISANACSDLIEKSDKTSRYIKFLRSISK